MFKRRQQLKEVKKELVDLQDGYIQFYQIGFLDGVKFNKKKKVRDRTLWKNIHKECFKFFERRFLKNRKTKQANN